MLASLALLVGTAASSAPQDPLPSADEIYQIAREASVYAYPIVTMDLAMRAPINRFVHVRADPGADPRERARDFDTLESSAWLDVSRGPIVLSVPDMGDRYYFLQLHDMWTDVFAVLGTRTTGSRAGRYAIVPPGWSGTLSEGLARIEAPTASVWIVGRTEIRGAADLENVHAVQEAYSLRPLDGSGTDSELLAGAPTAPPADGGTEPAEQARRLDGVTLLTRLAALLTRYPPHPNDDPILWRMRRIGIEAGRPFDAADLGPGAAAAIDSAARDALGEIVRASGKKPGVRAHGWTTNVEGIGVYGTSYRRRALFALLGLGANLPEDSVYPVSHKDVGGEPYNGENRYRLRFEKDELPPANAFWSLTLYDEAGFQVPNPIGRFAIGSRDALQFDSDGSLDLYIQNETPGGDEESNWLPAPLGRFTLTMRIHSPRFEVLDGSWLPPGVIKVTRGPPRSNR